MFNQDQARQAATAIGVDWTKVKFSIEDLRIGMQDELEHADVTGGDPVASARIALAHLEKDPAYYRGPRENPIQSLVLSKERFPTLRAAKAWVAKRGWKTAVDEKPDTWRFRQMDPKLFKSFGTKQLTDGVQAVVGGLKVVRANPPRSPRAKTSRAKPYKPVDWDVIPEEPSHPYWGSPAVVDTDEEYERELAENAKVEKRAKKNPGENPIPWIDNVFTKHWGKILDRVGPRLMPLATMKRKRVVSQELAPPGSYGAVYLTETPDVVLKVTSDPTEAFFVACALSLPQSDYPAGIVRYSRILQVDDSHRNRPVSLIWRQEAFDVGELSSASMYGDVAGFSDLDKHEVRQFVARLVQFRFMADKARAQLKRAKNPADRVREAKEWDDWAWSRTHIDDIEVATMRSKPLTHETGPRALAIYLRACEVIAEFMENERGADAVGGALSYYQEQGLLLCDVHTGNIGRITHPDYSEKIWAITDPGHAVSIRREPQDVAIERL